MSVWYGGIKLVVPDAAAVALLEQGNSLADVEEFRRYTWPPPAYPNWPVPTTRDLKRPIRLGRLFWPQGAQRWSIFHYLVHQPFLDQIRTQVYAYNTSSEPTYTPLPLILSDGRDPDVTVETEMYMLPPRPVNRSSYDPQTDWWILTLVDERYFWPERSASIEATPGTTSWTELFDLIAAGLGITLEVSDVNAAYLVPDISNYQYASLPKLLDACAASVGHKIIRGLDGTVYSQSYDDSLTILTTNLASANVSGGYVEGAGGSFDFDTTADLMALSPASVLVAFPRADSGTLAGTAYPVETTLLGLSLDAYGDVAGRPDVHLLYSSAIANFTGGGSPANDAEITALAVQMITDWYNWRTGPLDQEIDGLWPWAPEGLHDHIEWDTVPGTTRIQRPEWNDLEEAGLHYGTYGAASTTVINNLVVNNLTALQETVNYLTVNNGLTFAPQSVTLTTTQNNYATTSVNIKIDLTSANVTITGLAITNIAEGQLLFIQNISTAGYYLTLANLSASSLTANQFSFPTAVDYIVVPGGLVVLIYRDGKFQLWRPCGCFLTYKPSQITVNQNNYDPSNVFSTGLWGNYLQVIITTDASRNITGLVGGMLGRIIRLTNGGSFNAVITNADGSSSAANRIYTGTGASVTIAPGQSLDLAWFPSSIMGADGWYAISGGALGGGTSYTDEQAQDAVGGMVDATMSYNDAAPSLGVVGMKEGGGQILTAATIADGEVLWRTGNTIDGKAVISTGSVVLTGANIDFSWCRQSGTSPERWYCAPQQTNIAGLTTKGATQDILYAVPFIAGRGGVIDRLGFYCSLALGTEDVRLGIYAATSQTNLYPGAKFYDSGAIVNISSGATKHTTSGSPTLVAGTLYWFTFCTNATITINAVTDAAVFPIMGFDNTLNAAPNVEFSVAFTVGASAANALPDPYTAGGTILTSSQAHAIFCRFA